MLYRWNQNTIAYTQKSEQKTSTWFTPLTTDRLLFCGVAKSNSRITFNSTTGEFSMQNPSFIRTDIGTENLGSGSYMFATCQAGSEVINLLKDRYFNINTTHSATGGRENGYYGVNILSTGQSGYRTLLYTAAETSGTFVSYVYSIDSSAYPTNGKSNDYWYICFLVFNFNILKQKEG